MNPYEVFDLDDDDVFKLSDSAAENKTRTDKPNREVTTRVTTEEEELDPENLRDETPIIPEKVKSEFLADLLKRMEKLRVNAPAEPTNIPARDVPQWKASEADTEIDAEDESNDKAEAEAEELRSEKQEVPKEIDLREREKISLRDVRRHETLETEMKVKAAEWAAKLGNLSEQIDHAMEKVDSADDPDKLQDALKALRKLDESVTDTRSSIKGALGDLKKQTQYDKHGRRRYRDAERAERKALKGVRRRLESQRDAARRLREELASGFDRADDLQKEWDRKSEVSESGELTAGTPGATDGTAFAPDVTVTKVSLTKDVERVEIQGVGVVIGDGNQQTNVHRYELGSPRASLPDVLNADSRRLRAFATLMKDPDDAVANRRFRDLLSGSARVSVGSVRYLDGPARGSVRVSAARTGAPGYYVHDATGVNSGDGGTQHNTFNYGVEDPTISLEHALRDNPKLTRDMAVLSKHPHNDAVRRSVQDRLHDAYGGDGGVVRYLNAAPGRVLRVVNGNGVQVGENNTRTDKIVVVVNRPEPVVA
ncbi:hypothetical protein LUW74_14805 [Actinomadura madurae]|uniref:hypothetical protein n=1 Tax=Actinomadura madurae TaxID=1993 RepID=UPI002026ABF7|nr:hypothetical protein [Actinomadura madurae]URN04453.1 hypothetical protein LUW74_14805 [Actinomadura madurae]